MKIIISNKSDSPIYEQIKEQIKTLILSGELNEGDLLPSIRQLAKDLKISVITTSRAYSDLENEGFVQNVWGKGCYVSGKNNDFIREQILKEIEEHLLLAINNAKLAKIQKDEFYTILEFLMKGDNYE